MAKIDNLKDFLTDVADAIREKKGTTELINPQDFSAEIASIQSGGSGVVVLANDVTFYDYDGKILHSYTKDEFLALTEFPPLPTRKGLICQEWNWDFEDAVAYVADYGVLDVGATYITDDGNTRVYIQLENKENITIFYQQNIANGVVVNWGDGSEESVSEATGVVTFSHAYSQRGEYCITFKPDESCVFTLGGKGTGQSIIYLDPNNRNTYNHTLIKRAEIGRYKDYMGAYAFENTIDLESVNIPKNCIIYGESFAYTSRLKCLVMPKSSSISASNGLAYTQGLRKVILGGGMKSLGSTAFRSSSITSFLTPPGIETLYPPYSDNYLRLIVIPKSVTKMAGFSTCNNLSLCIMWQHEVVPTLTASFGTVASNCQIVVPDALYDEWIAATNWSAVADKIIKKSDWDALNA